MPTVLITGANGFIGRALGLALRRDRFISIGVARHSEHVPGYDRVYQGRLTQPLKNVFENHKIDIVIHCANASGADDYQTNVTGTRMWAEQAREAGVDRQVFLSSISVLQDSPSSYARAKKDLEEWFVANGGLVVRLGVVIGNGGIFERMKKLVQKLPMMPLLDNGAIPIYFSGISSVCDIILLLLSGHGNAGDIFNLQQEHAITMREMLQTIKKLFHYHCVFIPVPSAPIYYTLLVLEKIGVRFLPVSSVNIKGARQNRIMLIKSDYSKFGIAEQDMSTLIQKPG